MHFVCIAQEPVLACLHAELSAMMIKTLWEDVVAVTVTVTVTDTVTDTDAGTGTDTERDRERESKTTEDPHNVYESPAPPTALHLDD